MTHKREDNRCIRTYAVDAMRQTVLGPLEPLMLLGDMAALSLFLMLFLGVATVALRRDIR